MPVLETTVNSAFAAARAAKPTAGGPAVLILPGNAGRYYVPTGTLYVCDAPIHTARTQYLGTGIHSSSFPD
jgi:hypothetical protein